MITENGRQLDVGPQGPRNQQVARQVRSPKCGSRAAIDCDPNHNAWIDSLES